jgi:hypothetical protein
MLMPRLRKKVGKILTPMTRRRRKATITISGVPKRPLARKRVVIWGKS